MKNKTLYPKKPVLIIEDEKVSLKTLQKILSSAGITNTLPCRDSREVGKILSKKQISVILLDLGMPHLSGHDILLSTRAKYPDIPVILTTGDKDISSVVDCMREGAFDYVTKPINRELLISSLKRAIEISQLRTETIEVGQKLQKGKLTNPDVFSSITTTSSSVKNIFHYCEVIADSQSPILIQGEKGTGKIHFAKALHELSNRSGKFVTVDLSKLSEAKFESTLFCAPTKKNTKRNVGIVEDASGGTLYLKNIDSLTLGSQIKLLQLIDERSYSSQESSAKKNTDIAIIASTTSDLETRIQENTFRKDLFYRLRSHSFRIPSLRERPEDLSLLLDIALTNAAKRLKKKVPSYHKDLLSLLKSYHFPENITELELMATEAVKHHRSRMLSNERFKDHMGRFESGERDRDLSTEGAIEILCVMNELPKLREMSDALIFEAMERSGKNQRVAAHILGLSPQTMGNRIQKLNVPQRPGRRTRKMKK